MTDPSPEGIAGLVRPELLRLYPTPWHVTADGIKTASGIWVMSASNPALAHTLVELANYAGKSAAALTAPKEEKKE
jgi:hypothetical protein